MRRSTAAAVGTFAGTALILGVRLSVSTTTIAAPPAAQTPAELDPAANQVPAPAESASAGSEDRKGDDAKPSATPSKRGGGNGGGQNASGLKDGRFTGAPASNPYGVVQVTLTVAGGKITAANATYPNTGNSATVNADAIPKLKQATLKAQGAKIDAVSGATFTSEAYTKSLQAAVDAAKG